jgi:hypothetical protein
MHRSVSSLFDMGENSPLPAPNKPKGFWEGNDIKEFSEKVLDAFKIDLDGLSPLKSMDLCRLSEARFLLKDATLLQQIFFGPKSPRVAKLPPFLQKVFKHSHLSIGHVLALRNPLGVAVSLRA